MQSFCGSLIRRQSFAGSNFANLKLVGACLGQNHGSSSSVQNGVLRSLHQLAPMPRTRFGSRMELLPLSDSWRMAVGPSFQCRSMAAAAGSVGAASQDPSALIDDAPPRIKFKRLDKTARHIMQILDKEAVEEVRTQREIPDIRPGYIVQLKVEVPENKRRVSILKGVVIARRNAGLNTTFRIRRQVAGVGIESLFPLYSPNIKEIKVLDKKKVRRAKLYYLRDKMNALRK